MADITVQSIEDFGILILKLSEPPSTVWVDALRSYLAWSRGAQPPPGASAADAQLFNDVVRTARITVTDDIMTVAVPAGASYADDLRDFVEHRAIRYANSAAGSD